MIRYDNPKFQEIFEKSLVIVQSPWATKFGCGIIDEDEGVIKVHTDTSYMIEYHLKLRNRHNPSCRGMDFHENWDSIMPIVERINRDSRYRIDIKSIGVFGYECLNGADYHLYGVSLRDLKTCIFEVVYEICNYHKNECDNE